MARRRRSQDRIEAARRRSGELVEVSSTRYTNVLVPRADLAYADDVFSEALVEPTLRMFPASERRFSPANRFSASRFFRYDPLRSLRVSVPQRQRFCVSRQIRKQVLFARGVAGRSGGSPGPYRRNFNSMWGC